jgi:hypothetical protein
MWRTSKSAVFLIFGAGLALGSIPVFAQSLPSKKEATEWVRKAQEASNLQSPDAPPYHLVAKIRYTMNDKTMDGTYEILWSAPDKYRVEFRMGEIGETDLVLGDKKYVQRNTPTMTLPMWSVSSVLLSSAVLPITSSPVSDTVRKLSWLGEGANRQICAIVGESLPIDHELCFDAKTMELTATHTHTKAYRSVINETIAIDLTDYASLGKMRYPQHIVRQLGSEVIDAIVEKWEAVEKFDEKVFQPLSNSIVWDWCSAPKIEAPKSNRAYGPPIGVDPISGKLFFSYFGVYKVVRADGTVKDATLLFGSPNGPAKEVLDRQRRDRSAVRVCDGRPVDYETMFVVWPITKTVH